jgi:hypothetical protein
MTGRIKALAILIVGLLAVVAANPPVPAAEFELPAASSTLHGGGATLEGDLIIGWDDVGTFASWRAKLAAGEVEVVVLQAAEKVSAGHTYQVEIAGKTLPGTVKDTGGWWSVQPVSLGKVTLAKAGEVEIVLRPLKKGARGVMNLQGILLRGPAADQAALIVPEAKPVTVTPYVAHEFPDQPVLGKFFTKWSYVPTPFPRLAGTKDKLPAPIFDENPVWVAMYWKVWEIAFKPGHWYYPKEGSGFVSPYVDAAFTPRNIGRIYEWDTCFMTMFYNLAWPITPGIESLDNFYAHQYPNGEICGQIMQDGPMVERGGNPGKDILGSYGNGRPGGNRWRAVTYRGREKPAQPPYCSLDFLNHPLFAWAELEHYRMTGNKTRIGMVYEPLVRYYESFQTYVRQGNGLYLGDWGSMDNSTRNPYLEAPDGGISGCGVDNSCEMVLFARSLATMAQMLGKTADAARFAREADDTAAIINRLMWDPERKFYFDLTWEDRRAPVKTIAGFWSLLAGVASKEQADALAAELNDPRTFNRRHRVPTLAADEKGYDPHGGYWKGSAWAPTETMVIRGLERAGHGELAREIALNHLQNIGEIFQKTGTVWENYAADFAAQGNDSRPDFVGWTGIGPVLYFIEFAIGLKPDAPANTLTWDIRAQKRCGCERYRFNGHVADLVATPQDGKWEIRVHSDGEFTLKITLGKAEKTFAVKTGDNAFSIPAETGAREPAGRAMPDGHGEAQPR